MLSNWIVIPALFILCVFGIGAASEEAASAKKPMTQTTPFKVLVGVLALMLLSRAYAPRFTSMLPRWVDLALCISVVITLFPAPTEKEVEEIRARVEARKKGDIPGGAST